MIWLRSILLCGCEIESALECARKSTKRVWCGKDSRLVLRVLGVMRLCCSMVCVLGARVWGEGERDGRKLVTFVFRIMLPCVKMAICSSLASGAADRLFPRSLGRVCCFDTLVIRHTMHVSTHIQYWDQGVRLSACVFVLLHSQVRRISWKSLTVDRKLRCVPDDYLSTAAALVR